MKLPIKHQKTKTLSIKPNSRSSHYTCPNFILMCNAGCSLSYCYTRRFSRKHIYINDNIDEILTTIDNHSKTLGTLIPSQIDNKYHVYEIGCDTDILYHWKDYDWFKVLNYFNNSNIKATFATKFCSKILSEYKVNDGKIRIRFSMMPQWLSNILEPNTASNVDKLKYIQLHKNSGFDTQINLSPIIITDTWIEDYDVLLKQISELYPDMLFECIFLTHNENLNKINLSEGRTEIESYLWKPELQETKVSEYVIGRSNLRYKWQEKEVYIKQFKEVFSKYFNLNQIRYIF